jgi:hypothetical protein
MPPLPSNCQNRHVVQGLGIFGELPGAGQPETYQAIHRS